MASFVALNIEPLETVEEEVDDTKELQIEEALKLYQTALKLHSQGPEFYAQAREAYDALLNSEIFKYPEAVSDFQRTALQATAGQEASSIDNAAADTLAEYDINDAAASALPQTMHLSYKNNGQFLLDSLSETLREASVTADPSDNIDTTIAKEAGSAMRLFAQALERDDTDLELWRKSARIGEALRSCRLARYCLESVLVGDDNEVEFRAEQLGLEEIFATEDLQKVLQTLRDELSISQAPPLKKPGKALYRFLTSQTQDQYPYLPALPRDICSISGMRPKADATRITRHTVTASETTWAAVGKVILQVVMEEQQDTGKLSLGGALGIALPSDSDSLADEASPRHKQENALVPGESHDVEMSETKETHAHPMETQSQRQSLDPHHLTESIEDQSSVDQRAESQLRESLEVLSRPNGDVSKTIESQVTDDVNPGSMLGNSRKRSSASVVNDEAADSGRTKSRRIRARESNAENLVQTEEVGFDQMKYYGDRLEMFSHADEWLFGTVGDLLSKSGVEDLGKIDELKKYSCSVRSRRDSIAINAAHPKEPEAVLCHDLRTALMNWDEEKSRSAVQGDSSTSLKDFKGMNKSGLAIFLEHSRKPIQKPGKEKILDGGKGVQTFIREVNLDWLHLHDVAFAWLTKLLQPGEGYLYSAEAKEQDENSKESYYTSSLWPEALKETVVQLMIREDEFIYDKMVASTATLEKQILSHVTSESPLEYTGRHYSQMEMVQTLYELHLDVYALINNPNSEVDHATRVLQRDRLIRWGKLASTSVNHFMDHGPAGGARTKIALRHLWSTVCHSNMSEDAAREHILLCLQDLKLVLTSFGDPKIPLMNNAIMPEISVTALDQEISRLNSMDFFMRIFGSEGEDPVTLIESIEPILEPSSVEFIQEDETCGDDGPVSPASQFQDLASFLHRGDASLRLFLWRRLQDAYRAIQYPPKVVSCQLRSIENIMKEIRGSTFLSAAPDARPAMLLRWINSINDIMIKLLPQLLGHPEESFECIDVEHLRSSMSSVAQLSRLLHSFALYEDGIRVGQIAAPELRSTLARSLENFKDKLRDMQIRSWVLQYALLKEFMLQEKALFDVPADDRIQFLRAVHNAFGVRSACKYAGKVLLTLMRSELLSAETEENYETDIAQVLFDLHGFKFSPHDGTVDHGCPTERIDAQSASMIVDFVLMQVNRLSMKDVSKSDLKTTIDKVQQAISSTKQSKQPHLTFNKRVLNAYLKTPINPSQLLRAVQGVGGLTFMPVPIEIAKSAKKGWYFVLGHASLTKFRSQKRLSPVPTNELDDAIAYFRQDLEHASERWETWYRLAQAYDSKLDEDVTWSADKINNNHTDLVTLQRNAIHCYAMAVAGALKAGDEDPKSRAMLSELFTDFGMRLYASSREPLSMGPFSLAEFTRHFSDLENQQMYKAKPFKEMKAYSVWSLASYLFRRAMVDKPNYWLNQHMLSKCLWKMFNSDESTRGNGKRIELDAVLDSLLDAIETLPQRKDSRSDPVFEPHFRLVSVIHKLVIRQKIEPMEATKILSETPWARKVSPPQDISGWKPYILDVLKNLKNADKSNWHHRIIARAAHVHYDDDGRQDEAAAGAAKTEMMPQIFTKTMTLQVWRPEFERPGRHFVYTTRYAYYFVNLLEQVNDRLSLEQLLRRVRKKQVDFINHTKLWEDSCIIYAKLIRRAGNIPEKHDETIFKPVGWDEFVLNSARLEGLKDLSMTNLSTLELLREAIELKKMNNNLMKVTTLEDLIADIYARLYENNTARFIEQANEENRERMKVDHLLMSNDVAADTPTPPTSAPPSEAPAPRGRTKGISRRDVQKRAEAVVTRHLFGSRCIPTKVSAAPADDENRGAATSETSAPLPIREAVRQEATSGAQSSVPGSLQDSADDESELSEIDDERLAKLKAEQSTPLFPNLNPRTSPDPASELSAQISVDADEGADENEGNNEDEGDMDGETGIAENDDDNEIEATNAAEDDGGLGEEGEGDEEQEDADIIAADEGGEDVEGGQDEGEGEGGEDEQMVDVAEAEDEDEEATEDQADAVKNGDDTVDVDGTTQTAAQPGPAQDAER